PPSRGTRMTMPRPSLVTSSGPSPVRGFIAAIRHLFLFHTQGSVKPPYKPCLVIIPHRSRDPHHNPGRLARMHARSALFDLYGDPLRARGSQAPVAAIVRLLAPVGIAAPAVRTAISRMVMQGWL